MPRPPLRLRASMAAACRRRTGRAARRSIEAAKETKKTHRRSEIPQYLLLLYAEFIIHLYFEILLLYCVYHPHERWIFITALHFNCTPHSPYSLLYINNLTRLPWALSTAYSSKTVFNHRESC